MSAMHAAAALKSCGATSQVMAVEEGACSSLARGLPARLPSRRGREPAERFDQRLPRRI